MVRSEIGSGFEDPGGTPHQESEEYPPEPQQAFVLAFFYKFYIKKCEGGEGRGVE